MPLVPPQGFRNTLNTHRKGERADQPLATDVLEGTLYFVTDEGIIEQSDGTDWSVFSGAGSRLSYVVNYSYSVNPASPPGTNQVRFNAGFPYTAVTKLYFDDVTADGQDVHVGLLRVSPGSLIYVQDKNDNTQYVTFLTSGFPIDHTTWVEYDVTHYNHGTSIGGGQLVLVQSTWGPLTLPVFTPESVPFSDGSGVLTEDNPNFVYDNATNTLKAPLYAGPGGTLGIAIGTAGIVSATGQPTAKVYNSVLQTLTTHVATPLNFDVETIDIGGCFAGGSPTRLTCPTGGGGTYYILGQGSFVSSATGIRIVHLIKNGGTYIGSLTANPVTGVATIMQITAIDTLVAGDYIELIAYQDSGGNLDTPAAGNALSWMKVW